MLQEDRGDLVVTDNFRPVGIITERDISRKVAAKGLKPSEVKVISIMSHPLITIPGGSTLDDAIELMARKNIRRLLVEEAQEVIGVITEGDILAVFQRCGNCHKEIPMITARSSGYQGFTTCSCNTRYHRNCAEQIVHCLYCSATLVTHVIYPRPEETSGG